MLSMGVSTRKERIKRTNNTKKAEVIVGLSL
jgi:hypothetical protein